MKIDVELGEVAVLHSKMRRYLGTFTKAERDLNEEAARLLLDTIRSNASGRPGPNIVTGAYVNSWYIERRGFIEGMLVATRAPQAKRLEYGFAGVDSLGRNYNQPPFPHVRPAAQTVAVWYASKYGKLPGDVWRMT